MKYKYNVMVRGNIQYSSQDELEDAIAEKLAKIEGFTLTGSAYEVWQTETGEIRTFDSQLSQFTVQLQGTLLANSEAEVRTILKEFRNAYPEFFVAWTSISAWTTTEGLRVFNDDGTPYYPESEVIEETNPEIEVTSIEK